MQIYRHNFIGGRRVPPESEQTVEVRSPYDGRLLGVVPLAGRTDIDNAVVEARLTYDHGLWPTTNQTTKRQIIHRFWDKYLDRWDDIADLVAQENGIPIGFSASTIERLQKQLSPYFHADINWSRRGVLAVFVPWYEPQEAVLETLIPALLAGCCVILALAPQTALDGQLLGDLLNEAGLWEGVLSIVVVEPDMHEYIAVHPGVDGFIYYGAEQDAGRLAWLGRKHSKWLTINLRGRPSAIILPDADLQAVADKISHASFAASGACRANYSRLITPRHAHKDFSHILKEKASMLSVGDPLKSITYIGPAPSRELVEAFRDSITLGLNEGASFVCGGMHSDPEGPTFLEPTIFTGVQGRTATADDEILGPFAAIVPYADIDEAIKIANEHRIQRLSSVWTSDLALGQAISRKLDAQTVLLHQIEL